MLRLEFLQTLQGILNQLEAGGRLKKFLRQYLLKKTKLLNPEAETANDLLSMDVLESFEKNFNQKDITNQHDTQKVADLIVTAKISLRVKELETITNSEEKLARSAAFFTTKIFLDALRLLNINQLMQALAVIPSTHLSTLQFPPEEPEAFFTLYQRLQKTGEHLTFVRQLPQPMLQFIIKVDAIDKLADGLQEVGSHLGEQESRFKLLCLLEFYIRNRMHPNQNTFTSSGLLTGYVIAPVASLPGIRFFGSMFGYHDKESKAASAKKFQAAVAEQSWTMMLANADGSMKNGKSKQIFDKVADLANYYEPQQDVSFQDSVLLRTPSPVI
ncbi:MAG: hypothetical protein WAW86_08510 [Gammaproteobacteria bacterium]